eukprot:6194880-Pleurochrysis_carterae.AAC.2
MALAGDEEASKSLRITLHTYKPELRPNGRDRRPPEAQGGDNMVSVLPKRHSVLVDSQSWLTDSSESRKEGTQRTLRSRHVSDQQYTLRFAVYTRDDLIGRSSVYEIAGMRAEVLSTAAIDHKSDAFAAAAARMTAGSASFAAR